MSKQYTFRYTHPEFATGLAEETPIKVITIFRRNGEELSRKTTISVVSDFHFSPSNNSGYMTVSPQRTINPDTITPEGQKYLDSLKSLIIVRELED